MPTNRFLPVEIPCAIYSGVRETPHQILVKVATQLLLEILEMLQQIEAAHPEDLARINRFPPAETLCAISLEGRETQPRIPVVVEVQTPLEIPVMLRRIGGLRREDPVITDLLGTTVEIEAFLGISVTLATRLPIPVVIPTPVREGIRVA